MFGGKIIKTKVPSKGKMYEFKNRKKSMLSIRSIQKDEWANEVNKGYDFLIEIFNDLNKKINEK